MDCAKTPNRPGCCLDVLKLEGDLPDAKVSKYGTAKSVPTKPLEIKEGEEAVVITNESPMGHAVKVKQENDKLISVNEGGMGYTSEGREVSRSVIKGEVHLQ